MKRRAATTGLATVAVAIASLFACRQIVDFREEPTALAPAGVDAGADASAEAGAAACGLEYGTSRCASCVSAHCCSASSACAADPACAPYASCVGACAGDPTCRAQCALDSRPGNSDGGPALTACLVAQCETECGLTCGQLASAMSYGGVAPDAAAGCQSCVEANGCDVSRACGASTDCDALRLCFAACATNDCKQGCENAHDAGLVLSSALGSVIAGNCQAECGRGADWSCVGHVNWPRPKSDTVTMTIQVKDYVKGSPFSGVDASVCDRKDVTCAAPKAHGSTDSTGSVVLQFPNPVDMTFHGLNGYVQLTSPDIVPYLYYWGFPLSEPAYALGDSTYWNGSAKVLTPDDEKQLGSSVGIPYDPNAATVIASTFDCEAHGAPEVQITTDPPDPTVKELYGLDPARTATDGNAFATLVGVAPGTVDVIATPLALGKPSSRQTVNVRSGWVTLVLMFPTP